MKIFLNFPLLSLFAVLAFSGLYSNASAQDVKVSEVQWAIGGKNIAHAKDVSAKNPADAKIGLKMIISGSKESLETLKGGRKLPVQHKWYKYNGSRLFPIEVKVAMRISAVEVAADGSWKAECKSEIPVPTTGTYVGKILYYDRTAVTEAGKALEFTIKIE